MSELVTPPGPSSGNGSRRSPFLNGLGLASGFLTWAWAVVVLIVLLMIRWVGDRWWGVSVLLFLPRWLFLVPLPFLLLASGVARRPRHWFLQGVVALVIAGPLMLLSLPFHRLWDPPVVGTRLRIMTFNLGASHFDEVGLIRLIEEERIDLICFQEGHPDRTQVLQSYFQSRGWYRDRRKLFLASRYPMTNELPPPPSTPPRNMLSQANLIRARIEIAPGVAIGLATVHMPTLRFGFYRFIDHDIEGLEQHVRWWDSQLDRVVDGLSENHDVPFLVGGDFNVPSDHAPMVALGNFLRFGFEDAGWGYGYTRPSHYPWFRIDHILASPEWVFQQCWVGPNLGSDHLPLIAEVLLPSSMQLSEAKASGTSKGRE